MVTGASTADLAVILIDARKGVLTQTRRHSYLVSLLGIRHVVLAVNKLDLVDYSQDVFDADRGRVPRVSRPRSGSTTSSCIPMSALHGRQHHRAAARTPPWYDGPTLIGHLETVEIADEPRTRPVPDAGAVGEPTRPRLPRLLRRRSSAAPCAPVTASGSLPAGNESTVARIVTMDGDLDEAVAGQSVTSP